MGWRGQNAYDEARATEWRALPWRERYTPRFLLRLALLVAVVTALAWIMAAKAALIDAGDVHVIDGDTVRLFHKAPDVRLVGFNAPETRRAACAAERELGARATRRLRDLIRSGSLNFGQVRCSCKPGTQGTMACNYKRSCGRLAANEHDVGEILISEKLLCRSNVVRQVVPHHRVRGASRVKYLESSHGLFR